MKHLALISTTFFATLLVAQNPGRVALPEHATGFDLDATVTDPSADTTWVSTERWKAGFAADGVHFVPFFGSDASRDWSTTFRLREITAGGVALELRRTGARAEAARVEYHRGAVIERYELRPDGIEQSFVFAEPTGGGAIRIVIDVLSDLEAVARDGAITWHGPDGAFGYGRSEVIDARGEKIDLPSIRHDGHIEIEVPAAFVEQAAFPLVVDPLIGNPVTAATTLHDITAVDIAWSESAQRYAVCYQRAWSQTDDDVYLRLLDAAFVPDGNALPIDTSTTSWSHCRVAGLDASQRWLVVAEVSDGKVSPISVRGRMVLGGLTPTMGGPFDIGVAVSNGRGYDDCTQPDVGGDPAGGPTYFTVVWQRSISVFTDRIEFQQVTAGSALRFATERVIAPQTMWEHAPVISKSDGMAPFGSQGWAIVYRSDSPLQLTGRFRAAIVAWNGDLRDFAGDQSFPITPIGPIDNLAHDVSSPTDDLGTRTHLLAVQRLDAGTGFDVLDAFAFDSQGNVLASTTGISGGVGHALSGPSIDSDGCRFALACEDRDPSGNIDVVLRTLAVDGSQVVTHDVATLGGGTAIERAAAVVAHRSGGGAHLIYGAGYATPASATNWLVRVARYEGRLSAGSSTRGTGCGTVTIAHTGQPALGSALGIQVAGAGSSFGMLVGAPIWMSIPGCAGCLLGVDGTAVGGSSFPITVPCLPGLVGQTLSFQGFALGGGSCFGAVGLSDTLDLVIL